METPLALDYAPPPPWHRRRRVRRWIVVGVLAATMLPALWYRQALARRAGFLYYGWQCERYSAPADRLIYSTHPSDVERLANDPTYITGRKRDNTRYILARPPACWTRWHQTIGGSSQQITRPGNAIALLHELKNAKGQRWLVKLDWSAGTQHLFTIRGNWASCEVARGNAWSCRGDTYSLVQAKQPLRVFAGQVDPADASHFTIRYELAGRGEVIDGWLSEDNNVRMIIPAVERLRGASAAAQ